MKNLWKKIKKLMNKIYMKAVTDKGTPEYIARGWALGVFIGLLIPFGFQLMISIPLSFVLKGSKLGAMVGTLVTNHVTILIIYPLQCFIGNKLIGGKFTFAYLEEQMSDVILRQEYEVLLSLGGEVVASFFVGGTLFALLAAPLTYYGIKTLVLRYRTMREKRRNAKKNKHSAGKNNADDGKNESKGC